MAIHVSIQQIHRYLQRSKGTAAQIAAAITKNPDAKGKIIQNAIRDSVEMRKARIFRVAAPNSGEVYYITRDTGDISRDTAWSLLYLLTQSVEHHYPHLPSSESNREALIKACQNLIHALESFE